MNVLIDNDLRREFKAKAARDQVTMTDVLIRAINEYLGQAEGSHDRR